MLRVTCGETDDNDDTDIILPNLIKIMSLNIKVKDCDWLTIPGTNILADNIALIPPNKELEQKAKQALPTCIHDDVTRTNAVEFHFHAAYGVRGGTCVGGATHKLDDWPYLLRQLFYKTNFDQPIDKKAMAKELKAHLTSHDAHTIDMFIKLFVKLRFFQIMRRPAYMLYIPDAGKEFGAVHLVRPTYEPTFVFINALCEPKKRRFIGNHTSTWARTLTTFLTHMLKSRVAFSSETHSVAMFLTIGQQTLDFSFSLDTHLAYFVAIFGSFDFQALLVWHMILVNDLMKGHNMPQPFASPMRKMDKARLEYALQSVPEMWERSVPTKFKDGKSQLYLTNLD